MYIHNTCMHIDMLKKIPKISQMKLYQRRKSMSKVIQNNIISEENFKTISVGVNVKIWKISQSQIFFLNLTCCSKEFKLISHPFVAKPFKTGYFPFTFI